MRYCLFCLSAVLWNMVSVLLASAAANYCVSAYVESVPAGGTTGHPTPFLFLLPFGLTLLLCFAAFLVYEALAVKFWLPGAGWRHFLPGLILYLFSTPAWWCLISILDSFLD